ncbi:rCG33425, isoform CRA_e [Rattus norvegicus]|uniref:RCG33425, isoform CRA_e n=1 Tax=Rattus norvegicus TaxID=10116 RepID=A6HEF0_RAT|nr:rCG33425, isoform CRA_e [Rattus norvegicus]
MSGGWTAKKEENGLPPSEDSPAASAPQMRTARRGRKPKIRCPYLTWVSCSNMKESSQQDRTRRRFHRASDLRATDLVQDTTVLLWGKCLAVGPQDGLPVPPPKGLPFLAVSRAPSWCSKVKEGLERFSSRPRVY